MDEQSYERQGEAEQKSKRKIPRIVKQVIRWLFVALFAVLSLAAIYFKAPWKIITLFAILVVGLTLIPKAYRKWFYLSIAAVVLALIIWVFLPEDNKSWRPYKFDEELAPLQAKYTIPDEENAAIIYNKLLQDYDKDAFYTNLPKDVQRNFPMRNPWVSKDYPELAQWLQLHKGIIEKLLQASKMERCMFRISTLENFEKQTDRNAAMRQWALLLVSSANNDVAEGRTEESLQKDLALLKMRKHLCQQFSTIDWLVGIAVESLAISQFKTFLVTEENATDEYLNLIEEPLKSIKCDWSNDFLKILESNKLTTKRDFTGMFYEINPKGKIRISRDPFKKIREYYRKALENDEIDDARLKDTFERIAYPSYFEKKLLKATTILLWFYLPSSPKKINEIIDTIYQDYYEMAKPDFDWSKKPQKTKTSRLKFRPNLYRTIESLAGASKYDYYGTYKIYFRHQTEIKASRLIIASRRYKNKTGHWPENLDEIRDLAPAEIFVDPMNGNSFVYKLADDGFILYSKGKNNIDDGGKRDKWDEHTGADDWLIWPKKLPKTQEEKTDDQQQ